MFLDRLSREQAGLEQTLIRQASLALQQRIACLSLPNAGSFHTGLDLRLPIGIV